VDIVLAVVQEIACLSLISSEAESFSDGIKFLSRGKEQKHAHCDNIEIKCHDLVAEPGHYLRLINDSHSAVVEDDSSLEEEMNKNVREDLDKHKPPSSYLSSIFDKELTSIVTNYCY
jgi:hypothetical protein